MHTAVALISSRLSLDAPLLGSPSVAFCGDLLGSSFTTQTAFEKRIFKKARTSPTGEDAEVAIVDEFTCVYKTQTDLIAVLIGDASENELLLEAALDAIVGSFAALLKKGVTKAQVYKFLPRVLLALDEVLDSGAILSLDVAAIADRVMLKGAVPEALSSYAEITMGSAIERAREMAAKQFAR